MHEFWTRLTRAWSSALRQVARLKVAAEPSFAEPPIRAELYSVEQLERHARAIAALHEVVPGRSPDDLLERLPHHWSHVELHFRYRETSYHVRIESNADEHSQPSGSIPQRRTQLILDGTAVSDDFILLVDDRRPHEIVVLHCNDSGEEANVSCSIHP